jgi:anti-sigma B factor antagonist
MHTHGPVLVMELPENLNRQAAQSFLAELQPMLEEERPAIVLECSQIQQMDSAGVEMLLHCLEQAMKRDGDLKLAAVSPSSAVILELMRVDRLFEVFETADEAVRSFQSHPSAAMAPSLPWYATPHGLAELKAAS